MRDSIDELKTRIDKELRFIHFCETNDFSAERAYERLARIQNELYSCRIQADIAGVKHENH